MRSPRTRSASLINRAQVRRFILAQFERQRPQAGITRVSQQSLEQIEGWLRAKLRTEIHRHPTLGKTFKL